MGLTRAQRIEAIVGFRFTERQARFLELVMRHGGVCVPRQYARFAGVANGGEKCNEFFQKVVFRGRAVRVDCIHNRAAVYNINHRRLYDAIGEGHSRYRRAVPARQAIERLMLLDAVLTTPDLAWLTTQEEKLAHVTESKSDDPTTAAPPVPTGAPAPSVARVARLPGTFPIGIDAEGGRAVLPYLVLQPWTDPFRGWIQGHRAWLQRVPTWTIRLVFPRPLDRTYDAHQRVIREELETSLHTATVTELKWYFEHRPKRGDESPHSLTQRFLAKGAEVFSAPRFEALYRRWLKHGDVVFHGLASSALADALASGAGRVESVVLPHSYRHLAPVAPPTEIVDEPVEKAEERGEETGTRPQPPRSTPPAEELSVAERCARDWQLLVEADIERRRLMELRALTRASASDSVHLWSVGAIQVGTIRAMYSSHTRDIAMNRKSDVMHRDSDILSGSPLFVGTRVPVESLFDYLQAGDTLDEYVRQFPSVTREQAVAVLELARDELLAGARRG